MKHVETIEIPARQVPVLATGDVVVVGGGTAGMVAAVAAARAGVKTVLVERFGYVGGAATGTYATSCSRTVDSDGNRILGGIGWELLERLERTGGALINRETLKAQTFPEAIKQTALNMIEEAGVELLLHCWGGDVVMRGESIEAVICQTKTGFQAIRGRVFVDTTADADIAAAAGAPFELLSPDDLWQTSVDLTVAHVDAAKVVAWAERNQGDLVKMAGLDGKDQSGIRNIFSFIVKNEGSVYDGSGTTSHVGVVPTVKLMLRRSIARVQGSVEIDGTDTHQLTWAEIECRKRALEHFNYLQKNIPGFEDAFVIGESHLGVRETRRIIGEYVIQLDDLLNNARFEDVVALNARPLDRHTKGDHFDIRSLKGNHDVPLRALIPQGLDNLLVAGRCISSDHEANASLRGVATCMATGHAAGAAASVAARSADGKVRGLDAERVRACLKDQKAILSTPRK